MKNIFRTIVMLVIAFVLAITLTLVSSYVERVGPDLVSYGNLCGPTGNEKCYKPALKGGFPIPYLHDAPGVSRERQLAFGEDNVRLAALATNIVVYFAISLVAWVAWRRRSAVELEEE
ncbi:MAG: hypothetical protein EON58_07825 [Alphaproteobacteria bacterium]|nr:MAG: hypothetical protein EON58_07825 [Alphaproteobacteria bacterium]